VYIKINFNKKDNLYTYQKKQFEIIPTFILHIAKRAKRYRCFFVKKREKIDINGKASQLLEENPIAHVLLDLNWNIEYVNKKFFEITDFSHDDIIGSHITILSKIIEPFSEFDTILEKLNKDEKWYSEFKANNSSRQHLWVSAYLIPLLDKDNTLFNYLLLIQDITEQKKMFDQLRKLSRAVEQSPASVVITDISGNIEYVNPKFCELTGYSYEELISSNCRILKSGQKSKQEYKELWSTILSGSEWSGKFYNKKKDGSCYWESALISPLKNEVGEITHFIGVKEDITERKKSKVALKENEKKLRFRNQIIEKDLQNARNIQMALLPYKAPSVENLQIEYRFLPLEAVGGDYFAFYQIAEKELGIFVADVVGHGVSAALFLALLKYTSEIVAKNYKKYPDLFLKNLNEALYYGMYNYFITGVYGYFKQDKENGEVEFKYANGGHPPLLYHNREMSEIRPIKAKGSIIGMLEHMKYLDEKIILHKGDRIYFYTDGVAETRNSGNEIVGFQNVAEIVRRATSDSLAETLDNIIDLLNQFRGDVSFDDDIIVIGVEVE
jgi:sigma-B regulation protein RsbU (phosphoserine phosphatase)